MIFDYIGSDSQNEIARTAFERRCTFPWKLLLPKLQAGTEYSEPKSTIPVEWADLSRYAEGAASSAHAHIHEDGDTAHALTDARRQVLGLAWYSGKISIEQSLERDAELAGEVALSEGAHMIDFFYMTPDMRDEIFVIFHAADEGVHNHGWFEETGNNDYWSWVGEAFMGGFVSAFSDYLVTLDAFTHSLEGGEEVDLRQALMPVSAEQVFGLRTSSVVHDSHMGIALEVLFDSYDAAIAAGRRGCRVCKPERRGS